MTKPLHALIWSNEHGAWRWGSGANGGFTTFIDDAHRFPLRDAVRLCREANRSAPSERHPYEVPVLAPEHIAETERIAASG
jgi:hypothetical protein